MRSLVKEQLGITNASKQQEEGQQQEQEAGQQRQQEEGQQHGGGRDMMAE